jgi:hypothetical protein
MAVIGSVNSAMMHQIGPRAFLQLVANGALDRLGLGSDEPLLRDRHWWAKQ